VRHSKEKKDKKNSRRQKKAGSRGAHYSRKDTFFIRVSKHMSKV
jgi:hypothetical protein